MKEYIGLYEEDKQGFDEVIKGKEMKPYQMNKKRELKNESFSFTDAELGQEVGEERMHRPIMTN